MTRRIFSMNPAPTPYEERAAREAAQAATSAPERLATQLLLQVQRQPDGPFVARECLMPPGADSVAFGYLGDMRLRFVFDAPGAGSVSMAHAKDFARLGLTPARAMVQALANLRRLGPPAIVALGEGVYGLRAPQRAYATAQMLDRGFWRQQLEKFPLGLLAAAPAQGVLMFTPAGDEAAERALVRQAARALASAGPMAVSAWVYRFGEGGWAPHAPLPVPQSRPASAADGQPRKAGMPRGDSPDESPDALDDSEEHDLDKAATGQKMLIASIVAGLVINAAARTGLPPTVLVVLALLLGTFSLLGVVRLCSGLGKSTGWTVACMVLSFVPLLSLACWITLSVQATRALRAAGWKVGLLGARA